MCSFFVKIRVSNLILCQFCCVEDRVSIVDWIIDIRHLCVLILTNYIVGLWLGFGVLAV